MTVQWEPMIVTDATFEAPGNIRISSHVVINTDGVNRGRRCCDLIILVRIIS